MKMVETLLEQIFGMIFDGIGLLFTNGIPFIFKFINIILWAMAGALILPTVFVAGNIYPLWEKWAESLKK